MHRYPRMQDDRRNQACNASRQSLKTLMASVIRGWPTTRADVKEQIDSIEMKGRIVVPASLKQRALEHLYINHKGIEKMKLLAREPVYWININSDIKNAIKIGQHVWISGHTAKDKPIPHDIQAESRETVGAEILMLNYKTYLYVVDYHKKFPVLTD